MKRLGADHILNYHTDDIETQVDKITGGKGVERMVDVAFGINVEKAPNLIQRNGCLTAYSSDGVQNPKLPFLEFMYRNISIQPFSIFGMPEVAKIRAFEDINEMLKTGSLKHQIGREYSFKGMISAHQAIETGALFGCCLVRMQ